MDTIDADESQQIINSMKRKNIIYWDDEPLYDSDDDILYDDRITFNISDNMPYMKIGWKNVHMNMNLVSLLLVIYIIIGLFGIKHFGIEKFQKWRDYWKKTKKNYVYEIY